MSTEDFKQMVTPCDDPYPMNPTPTPAPTPRTDEAFHQYNEDAKYHAFREKVRTLERELQAKDAEIARLTAVGPVSGASESDVYQWLRDAQARVTELERLLAAAGEDKARLDWLAEQIGPGYAGGIVTVANLIPTHGGSLRAAIDAARDRKEQP